MDVDLRPVRRAQNLLIGGHQPEHVVIQLQRLYSLRFADAMAALAAAALLLRHGLATPEEPFARPYVRAHHEQDAPGALV